MADIAIYLAGTPVTLTIPLADRAGNALNCSSVDYQVLDDMDNVLIARNTIAPFTAGQASVTLTVPSPFNALNPSTDPPQKARTVQLFCQVGGNTVLVDFPYGITQGDPLVVGVNSFQTYATALMTALQVPNTTGWDAATDDDRIAALMDARNHLCKLNYNLLNSNVNYSQDQLAYLPEGVYQSQFIARNSLFLFSGNLELLTPQQFTVLPQRFTSALNLAQIAEADFILGGDKTELDRQSGITLDAIGETKRMYRSTKPLELPVCKRAMRYVSYFVTFAKVVTQG
jgi:hypothetical protein